MRRSSSSSVVDQAAVGTLVGDWARRARMYGFEGKWEDEIFFFPALVAAFLTAIWGVSDLGMVLCSGEDRRVEEVGSRREVNGKWGPQM